MMKRLIIGTVLMCAMAGTLPAESKADTVVIPLHYLDAKNVSSLVKTTRGLESITVNFLDNSVSAHGSTAALATLKAELATLDVQTTAYRLDARVVRYRVEADGQYSEEVVMSPQVMTLDKFQARVSVTGTATGGFTLLLTPSRNADNSVTLLAEVQEVGEQGEIVRSGKNEKRVALGEATRVTGMTDAADKALRRRVLKGEVVRNHGAYTGYYVEVRAAETNGKH